MFLSFPSRFHLNAIVQVEDIIIPVEEVEDGGVEISVGVDGIMEDVTIA